MATTTNLAIRRNEAYGRIEAAVQRMGAAFSPLRHRDPDVEQTLRIEALADALDSLSAPASRETPAQASVGAYATSVGERAPVGKAPRR